MEDEQNKSHILFLKVNFGQGGRICGIPPRCCSRQPPNSESRKGSVAKAGLAMEISNHVARGNKWDLVRSSVKCACVQNMERKPRICQPEIAVTVGANGRPCQKRIDTQK